MANGKMSNVASALILMLSICSVGNAQRFDVGKKDRRFILSGGLGTATYFGDLSSSNFHLKADPNINVAVQYGCTKRISARVELNWFALSASDNDANGSGQVDRNLSFRSSNYELSAVGIFDLFAHGDRHYRRPRFNVFGFAGVGVMYFNPTAVDPLGSSYSLQSLKTEGVSYSLVSPVIPVGVGVRFWLSPTFNLSVEASYRHTFTDYLDDVSTTYPGSAFFNGDAQAMYFSDRRTDPTVIGTAGGKRGNPNDVDSYLLLGAKLEYYLPWSRPLSKAKKIQRKMIEL